MTRLALAAACCVMALGTAAQAQVTGVSGTSTTQVQLDSLFNNLGGLGQVEQGGGAAYYSAFAINPSNITFESANASIRGDNQVSSTSSTSVDITIKNNGSAAVDPLLKSTITGAGLGVYLANTGGGCAGSGVFSGGDPFGGCAQTTGGQTIAGEPASGRQGATVAGAAFDFTVTANGNVVYDLSGIERVTLGDGSLFVDPIDVTLNGAAVDPTTILAGFNNLTPGNPGSANGYMWDDSNVSVDLKTLLGVGESMDVVYTATVTTFSAVDCDRSDPNVCLVPYAAFGDPIGKSGGTNLAPVGGGLGFDARPLIDTGSGGINFVDDWGLQKFGLPTFVNGVLTFGSGVPEPKTWMSLILGFGLVGAALRRRRVLSYT